MTEKQRDRFASHMEAIIEWKDGVIERHGSIIGMRVLGALANVGPVLADVVAGSSGQITCSQAVEELQFYVDFVRGDLEKNGEMP